MSETAQLMQGLKDSGCPDEAAEMICSLCDAMAYERMASPATETWMRRK